MSQSEEQDITRNFERIDSHEIRSETENEIRKLAQKCEEEGMIKKSAYEGNFWISNFLFILETRRNEPCTNEQPCNVYPIISDVDQQPIRAKKSSLVWLGRLQIGA